MRKVNLVFGTVYGNAQFVAEEAEQALQAEGWQTQLLTPEQLDNYIPEQDSLLVVICSTTGQGISQKISRLGSPNLKIRLLICRNYNTP